MALQILYTYNKKENKHHIELIGELNCDTFHDLDPVTLSISESPGDLIIRCEQLDFVDRNGLEKLVELLKISNEHNFTMILEELDSNIHKLIRIVGLDKHSALKIS